MNPAMEFTSVPAWAVQPQVCPLDTTGAAYTAYLFGEAALSIVDAWQPEMVGRPLVRRVFGPYEAAPAAAALSEDFAAALVGWRIIIAGPAATCLKLRAAALHAGLADDEIMIASTDVSRRDVACIHCGATMCADVEINATIVCSGCRRNLLVYYHVSRLRGEFLGFDTDAEQGAS